MTVSKARRTAVTRLIAGLLAATLAIGVFGATGATAGTIYANDAPFILTNVPVADLLANSRGICDGAFDIVIANADTAANSRYYLDAAQRCGLKVVLHFSTTTTTGGTVYPSRVPALVAAVKDHPALYGYLSVSEPSWTHISAAEIRSLYRAYHAADPNHPVIALFGDIPHFGGTVNRYTAGMANIVMVDWYPVETARGGCASTGSTYIPYGPKWYRNKVRAAVAARTPGTPIWVMVQAHKYTAPRCHKKQRPTLAQMVRQVHDAFYYAGASGIAFHTFSNKNYNIDLRRDAVMMSYLKSISGQVRAGTFQ